MEGKRFLGVTVLADFILNEGIEPILANLSRIGATAVALNPTVTAPTPEGEGSFQPPTDAGSSPRLFDRPLWGRRSLWVRSAPSYRPNAALYEGGAYGPRRADALTEAHGDLVGRFIDAALAGGFEVYFQIAAARPSALRDEDRPRLPDGRLPQDRMADTASLASPAVRTYNAAYVADLLARYPQISGFRPDWPEYPCYKLDEAFQDFGPHVEAWAVAHGFNFGAIRDQVGAFYTYLHGGLRNSDLEEWTGADAGRFAQTSLLRRYPAVLEWLRLKAALSVDLLGHWRQILDANGTDKKLSANAFMPPLTLWTGFDFAGAAAYCQAASPKLYTMHWSAMVEFWGRVLLERNTGLDERLLVGALARLFDLGDEIKAEGLGDYGYPEPDQAHPVPDAPQRRRIGQALTEAGAGMQITPLVHGYGPVEDFSRRLEVVAHSPAAGAWINRYGYLSDAKLDAIERIWRVSDSGAVLSRP
jgi:hypothetical protein